MNDLGDILDDVTRHVVVGEWLGIFFTADRTQRLKQAKLDASSEIQQFREMKERKFSQAEATAVRRVVV